MSPSAFPAANLLPKTETQAADFVKKFPNYNGRGIRVGVLDTGVDPHAFGLQGRVVDMYDCSGSGDVILKAIQPNSTSPLQIASPSGRTLTLNKDWKNPSGEWKVGIKRAFDLWPGDLVKRLKTERRKEWDVKQSDLIVQVTKQITDLDKKAEDKPADPKDAKKKDVKADKSKEDDEKHQKSQTKADLEARLSYLKGHQKDFDDPGPTLEVVAWHDGSNFRCVIGGAETDNDFIPLLPLSDKPEGKSTLDLSKRKPMTDFRKEKHYERFGNADLLSYGINFFDNGEIVSIVVCVGTHGTHVSSIIASNVPKNPELNGIAPEVEIVSLTIGDNRLATIETNQSMLRACKAIIDSGCHLLNMSFGEDGGFGVENKGIFVNMLRDEVIKRNNVIFVTSAGNSGPALTTGGAPGTMSGCVTVGAYETQAMQQAEYALLDKVPDSLYTWSSRTPTYDGAKGVTTFAPGGAIAGIPTYSLQRTRLMNGTSMASPNACGGIALVLSALKAQNISWTPARVQRAIEVTNKDVKDDSGIGMLQVSALYDYLVKHKDRKCEDAEFEVAVVPLGHSPPDLNQPRAKRQEHIRGIYLREEDETQQLYQARVYVKPTFPLETQTVDAWNLDMQLELEASHDWIKTPQFVAMASAGRDFAVQVDPSKLKPGFHVGSITAWDIADPKNRIQTFRVDVTIAKPEPSNKSIAYKDLAFSAGKLERHFLAVPQGATFAEITVVSRDHDVPVQLWAHCVQLRLHSQLRNAESGLVFNLNAGESVQKKIPVVGGLTMEMCLSQAWQSIPTCKIDVQVEFRGIVPNTGKEIKVLGGGRLTSVECKSLVRIESFSPSITLDSRRTYVRPTSSVVSALGERDMMPNGKRLFSNVLTYKFKQAESGQKTTLSWPVSGYIYDSAFSMLSAIYDSKKKLVKFGDPYPKTVELEKGEYTVMLYLASLDHLALERVKDLVMTIDTKLSKKEAVSMTVYADYIDAFDNANAAEFKNIKMTKGESRMLVIHPQLKGEGAEAISSKAGDVLAGRINLVGGASAENLGLPFYYVIPPASKKDEGEKDKEENLLVDLQLSIVEKIENKDEKIKFIDQLIAANPKHLAARVARLKALEKEADKSDVKKTIDSIISLIDESKLAEFLGRRQAPEKEMTKAEKKTKKEYEAQKAALLAAYNRLVLISSPAEIAAIYKSYQSFADPAKDVAFLLSKAQKEFDEQRYGIVLDTAAKIYKLEWTSEEWEKAKVLEKKALKALEWQTVLEYEARWDLVRNPGSYVHW